MNLPFLSKHTHINTVMCANMCTHTNTHPKYHAIFSRSVATEGQFLSVIKIVIIAVEK